MIKVSFDPTSLTGPQQAEWTAWQARADAAMQDLIDAWETWLARPERKPAEKFKFKWNNDIWSALKTWLKKNVFNNKCAYCETKITRFVGDAEHYRPKGRVSIKQAGKTVRVTVCVDESGVEVAHPGYFWLAYDWQNLLPSCERCNKMRGKLDQFPVSATHWFARRLTTAELGKLCQPPYPSKRRPGWYYLRSEDLNVLEQPRLLHPYFDNPHQHLRFGFGGTIAAIDGNARGQASIEVYDLQDDGDLRTLRQTAQEIAEHRWLQGYGVTNKPVSEAVQEGQRAVATFAKGVEPHSAAALDWIREKYPNCGL